METESLCQAYGSASAVFVGQVVEGTSMESMSEMIGAKTKDLTFKFDVKEAFNGASIGKQISVHTGFGFGDCGVPFQKSATYIVYAYERDGVLNTSICTRTRPIERSDDAKELRSLLLNADTVISGTVERYSRSSLKGYPMEPLNKQRIEAVSSSGQKYETETNEDGQFLFRGVSPGRYRLVPNVEPGWEVDDYQTAEFSLNDHGCATKKISIENDSSVAVTIRGPDGRAVSNVWVEFIPIDIESTRERFPREFSVSNPQGQLFNFGLPPGKYTVSINYFNAPDKKAPFPATFAPGVVERSNAEILDIRPGSKIDNITIKVPFELQNHVIKGVIVWPDGKPAKNVSVGLTDVKADDTCVDDCVETDIAGRFTLNGYEGREYKIWARGDKKVNGKQVVFRAESPGFNLSKNLTNKNFVLKRTTE